jgi:hypothetical protein
MVIIIFHIILGFTCVGQEDDEDSVTDIHEEESMTQIVEQINNLLNKMKPGEKYEDEMEEVNDFIHTI